MTFENTTFHLSDKYLFLNLSLSAELCEKQECSKILLSEFKILVDSRMRVPRHQARKITKNSR